MSDNPYSSPGSSGLPAGGVPGARPPFPGFATAIAIVALILGCLNLFGYCCMGGSAAMVTSTAFQEFMQKALESDPKAAADFEENMKQSRELMNEGWTVMIIQVAVGMLIGLLLLIGGIGVLRRKESGRKILVFASLTAIVFIVISYVYSILAGQFGAGMENMPDEQKMMAFISIGVGVLYSLACIVYYVVTWRYLSAEERRAHFS